MGSLMDAKKGADNHSSKPHLTEVFTNQDLLHLTQEKNTSTGPATATLLINDSEQLNAGAGQSRGEGKSLLGLPVYLVHRDKGIVQPLNVPARNEIVHKNPALLKHVVADAFQRQANKVGFFEDIDCVVRWKSSAIRFHIEFEISVLGNRCQHLASVRKIPAQNPVSTRRYTLLIGLTEEVGPVCEESCSTCKAFLKQATCKSVAMKPFQLLALVQS